MFGWRVFSRSSRQRRSPDAHPGLDRDDVAAQERLKGTLPVCGRQRTEGHERVN